MTSDSRNPELTFATYKHILSLAIGVRSQDTTIEKVFTLTIPTCFILELMNHFPSMRCTRLTSGQSIQGFTKFFFYPASSQV